MPITNDLFDDEMLSLFHYWIRERHRIWMRRMAGDVHLTDDPIMQNYRFCNVFRFLDRGSQWIIEQLNSEYGRSLSPEETLVFCSLYRRTNNVDAWIRIKEDHHLPRWGEIIDGSYLDLMKKVNEQVHFANNRVYNVGNNAIKGLTIIEGTFSRIQHQMTDEMSEFMRSDPSWIRIRDFLMNGTGVGLFLAQQIVTDYGYSQYGSLNWENQFVNSGPGSTRGLRKILTENPSVKSLENTFNWIVVILRSDVLERDVDVFVECDGVRRLPSLMDVQNCLCEFDKFTRYRYGDQIRGRRFSEARLRDLPELQIPVSWKESN